MPTYEYRCENCGKFETEQGMKEEPLKICPKCGAAVKRLISSSGIVFRGSGFHVTDYRKEKQGTEQKKPEPKKPEPKK